MSENESPQSVPKIRTFKQDYERIKGSGAISAEPSNAEVKQTEPTTQAEKKSETEAASSGWQEVDSITAQVRNRGQQLVPPKKVKPTTTPQTASPTAEAPTETTNNKIDPSELSADIMSQLNEREQASIKDDHRSNVAANISDDVETGSIITDTKKDRFKLLPAIWHALTGWYQEKEEEIEDRLTPKEMVEPGRTRADVIRQAAAGSALAPRDDHGQVSERLKHVERTAVESSPVVIKDKAVVTQPSWSYTKEETSTETTTPETNVTKPNNIQPEPTTIADDGYTPTAVPAPAPEQKPEPEQPLPPQPEAPTTSELDQPISYVPQSVTAQTSQAQPKIAYGASLSEPTSTSVRLQPSRTLMTIAIILAVTAGVGVSVWFFGGNGGDSNVVTNSQANVPQTIAAQDTVSVALGVNRETLLQSILVASASTNSTVTQIYPTHSAGPATTEEIMAVLDWRAPGGFVRGIKSIAFGKYRGQTPFIVLQVTSFETAFGGMLTWESDMSADLAPLFGETVRNTFDPNARTSTQTRAAFFVDKPVGTLDTRLLKDEKAADRIIYTFLDQNTILITTSVAALEEIEPYVKE